MLRPGSWIRPAGVSPVPVGTGAPGSGPQFVGEIWRAERGVESLFGGSKRAGRSIKRTLQPRHRYNERAEPLMSRRRPCLAGPVPGSACEVSSGYGWWHVRKIWSGTGETRLREGREGFDFLGCHLRARMSGRMWEQYGKVRYYLHRWPSQRAIKNARIRVKALTGRNRVGIERLLIKRRGRKLRAGQAARWSEAWFHDQGLHKLLGTIRYPKAA